MHMTLMMKENAESQGRAYVNHGERLGQREAGVEEEEEEESNYR